MGEGRFSELCVRCGALDARGCSCGRVGDEVMWAPRGSGNRRLRRAVWVAARALYVLPLSTAVAGAVLVASLAARVLGLEPLFAGSSPLEEAVGLAVLIAVVVVEVLFITMPVRAARRRAHGSELAFHTADLCARGWVDLHEGRVVQGGGSALEPHGELRSDANVCAADVIEAGAHEVAAELSLRGPMHALALGVLLGMIARGELRAFIATSRSWERRRSSCWRDARETIAIELGSNDATGAVESDVAGLVQKSVRAHGAHAIELNELSRLACVHDIWRSALAPARSPAQRAQITAELRRFAAQHPRAYELLTDAIAQHLDGAEDALSG